MAYLMLWPTKNRVRNIKNQALALKPNHNLGSNTGGISFASMPK
jgi:hypothetical protein